MILQDLPEAGDIQIHEFIQELQFSQEEQERLLESDYYKLLSSKAFLRGAFS